MPFDKAIRRHPGCKDATCTVCLEDHIMLGNLIQFGCNYSSPHDWLLEYREWLDKNNIPSEDDHGWGTEEAFDMKNIEAFIEWWNEPPF